MTTSGGGQPLPQVGGAGNGQRPAPANLGDILERVLDKGLVIAGDIQVNLLDIELLTIKLRLVIASLDTAREVGIDWWERDPWLRSDSRQLEDENKRLRDRIARLEQRDGERTAIESGRSADQQATSERSRGEVGQRRG